MHSSTQAFVDLLLLLFGRAVEMRMFVVSLASTEHVARALPDDTVSPKQMAYAVVAQLRAHGLEPVVFAGLLAVRPLYAAKIRSVAALFESPGGAPTMNPRNRPVSARTAVWVLAGGLLGVLAYRVASTPGEDKIAPVTSLSDDESSPESADHPASMLAGSDEILPLSGSEADPITLRLVSRREGRAWRVAVSRHRGAAAAAEALFYKFLLGNARDGEGARVYLEEAEFKLCQGSRCHDDAVVGDTFTPDGDVTVRFRVPEYAASNPTGKPLPDRRAAEGLEEFNDDFHRHNSDPPASPHSQGGH